MSAALRWRGLEPDIAQEEFKSRLYKRAEYAAEACGKAELDVCLYLLGEKIGGDIYFRSTHTVEV